MKDLSDEARSLLDAARGGDDPTEADRERLRPGVARAIAAGGVILAAGSAKAGAAVLSTTVIKIIVGVVVVGAAGAATVVGVKRQHGTSRPPVEMLQAPYREQLQPVEPVLEAEPSPAIMDTRPAPRSTPKHVAKPDRRDGETLEAETQGLRAIQEALRSGEPELALRLLDEQARSYPSGALKEERDAARIIALCDLHRTSQASSALKRFKSAHRRSPLLGRVQTACSGSGVH